MNIDERIEPLVREALQSVVKRDEDRLDAALRAFPDEAARRAGVELLGAICAYVLVDLHDGHRPTEDQVRVLAAHVSETESWSGLSEDEISVFLLTVLGDTSQSLDPDAGVMLSFVVTGSLLASRRRPEDVAWFNYLDQVEAAIEATP